MIFLLCINLRMKFGLNFYHRFMKEKKMRNKLLKNILPIVILTNECNSHSIINII